MSIVDRLPELQKKLPEEVRRLEHEVAVREAVKTAEWQAKAANLEKVARSLPISDILTKLVDSKLKSKKPELSAELAGNSKDDPEPKFEWLLDWVEIPGRRSSSILIELTPNGNLIIDGQSAFENSHTSKWKRSVSSSLKDLEEAIGWAYLTASKDQN